MKKTCSCTLVCLFLLGFLCFGVSQCVAASTESTKHKEQSYQACLVQGYSHLCCRTNNCSETP